MNRIAKSCMKVEEQMGEDNKKKANVLVEVIIGIIIFAMVVQAVLVIIGSNLLYNSVGLWVGASAGVAMSVHMKRTIEDALDLGAYHAEKYLKKKSLLRMGMVVLVFGALFYYDLGSIYTTFIGAMGLKISAYLQPYIYKLRNKN